MKHTDIFAALVLVVYVLFWIATILCVVGWFKGTQFGSCLLACAFLHFLADASIIYLMIKVLNEDKK